MITEDYCSFEVAKLLKEKGFDGECFAYHLEKDNILGEYGKTPHIASSIITYSILHDDVLLCPTHQMAMKWLRKVHNKHVQIYYLHGAYQEFDYVVINTFNGKAYHEPVSFSTYEEAVEAALKYSLENLM